MAEAWLSAAVCICEVHVKASLLWTVYRPGGTSNAEAMGGGIGGIIEKPAHVIRLTENRVYLTFVSSYYLLNLEVRESNRTLPIQSVYKYPKTIPIHAFRIYCQRRTLVCLHPLYYNVVFPEYIHHYDISTIVLYTTNTTCTRFTYLPYINHPYSFVPDSPRKLKCLTSPKTDKAASSVIQRTNSQTKTT